MKVPFVEQSWRGNSFIISLLISEKSVYTCTMTSILLSSISFNILKCILDNFCNDVIDVFTFVKQKSLDDERPAEKVSLVNSEEKKSLVIWSETREMPLTYLFRMFRIL